MSKNYLSPSDKIGLFITGTVFSVILVGMIGYVVNIVKLFGADFTALNAELVIRIIGIFLAPVGAIAGYF